MLKSMTFLENNCYLDGITKCDKEISCQECAKQEDKWLIKNIVDKVKQL